jgi:hypothetical protein
VDTNRARSVYSFDEEKLIDVFSAENNVLRTLRRYCSVGSSRYEGKDVDVAGCSISDRDI